MIRQVTCACVVLLVSSLAGAAVVVGDKPKMQFKAFGPKGANVRLEDYKGKIVVVDFWATWCGPCMDEAEHMVSIYQKYNPKGLEFIGVSLDSDGAALTNVIKQKNFTWPQQFDGKGWKTALAVEWGVESIPQTFLIGPEGDVLWTGHPGAIDRPLESAFKDHPPQLVDPKLLAEANETLSKAESALQSGAQADALAAIAKIPAKAKQDPKLATHLAEVQKSLEASAEKMLTEADVLVSAEKYPEASAKLKSLAEALEGSPLATKAKTALAELSKNPQAKASIEAAEKNQKAAEALAVARKLQSSKNDEGAYIAFKAIVKSHPGTDAAKVAADAVATYEKDPAFAKRAAEKEFGAKAKSMLSLAANYRSAGKPDLARKKYQEVIDQFPNTSFAETAKKELAATK